MADSELLLQGKVEEIEVRFVLSAALATGADGCGSSWLEADGRPRWKERNRPVVDRLLSEPVGAVRQVCWRGQTFETATLHAHASILGRHYFIRV